MFLLSFDRFGRFISEADKNTSSKKTMGPTVNHQRLSETAYQTLIHPCYLQRTRLSQKAPCIIYRRRIKKSRGFAKKFTEFKAVKVVSKFQFLEHVP
jgi:hypothetical protein